MHEREQLPQRDPEQEDKGDQYLRRERRLSSVYRRIGLPAEVRTDEISATFENGVLHVTVPRVQKAQPRRIPVAAGACSARDHRAFLFSTRVRRP